MAAYPAKAGLIEDCCAACMGTIVRDGLRGCQGMGPTKDTKGPQREIVAACRDSYAPPTKLGQVLSGDGELFTMTELVRA